MTRARWIIAGSVTAALLILAVAYLWHRGRVDPLPVPVRHAVEDERLARARVDSQIVAATMEAQAAQERQEEATQRAQASERRARIASDRADSLARIAEQSTTAQDSARYYHGAYDARTSERDTLLNTIAEKDTALDAADDRIAALTISATIAQAARQRADSVLDAVVASVTVCTVPGTFGRIRCPSRKTALAVGLIGGVVAQQTYKAVHDGRLRIPLVSR